MHGQFGLQGVFAFAALGTLLWFVVAYSMKNPRPLSSYMLNVGALDEYEANQLARQLNQVQGVVEAVVIAAEGIAYLKVDRNILDRAALQEISVAKV